MRPSNYAPGVNVGRTDCCFSIIGYESPAGKSIQSVPLIRLHPESDVRPRALSLNSLTVFIIDPNIAMLNDFPFLTEFWLDSELNLASSSSINGRYPKCWWKISRFLDSVVWIRVELLTFASAVATQLQDPITWFQVWLSHRRRDSSVDYWSAREIKIWS